MIRICAVLIVADQTARIHRLDCALVVHMQQRNVCLHRGPFKDIKTADQSIHVVVGGLIY